MAEVQKMQEQFTARTSLYIPACVLLHTRDTTAMDGGSAENAGAIYCPYVPVHSRVCAPAHAGYRTSLYI